MKFKNPFRRVEPTGAAPMTTSGWRKWLARTKKMGSTPKMNTAIVTEHPNYGLVGLVFGISWHQHLLRDAVAVAATNAASRSGADHIFCRPKARSVSTYGVVRISSGDKKRFPRLVPAAIVFAESLKDKETATVLLLDLRDMEGEGSLFMCMALRGDPVPDREFLGSEDECVELLRKWTNSTPNGVHLLLDLHPGELRSTLQAKHPSNDDYSLTDQTIGLHLDLKPVSLLPFKKWHLGFAAALLAGYFAYDYGLQWYEQKISKAKQEEANNVVAKNYLASRDGMYAEGYPAAWNEGFAQAYAVLARDTFIKNGWRFEQAKCTVSERKCRLVWTRLYGTYNSLLEGLDPKDLEIDASDYRTGIETRAWAEQVIERPALNDLPPHGLFIKQNGDRKDTLLLSGFSKYDTGVIAPLIPWTGQGVAPGLEILSAAWSAEAGLDLMLELTKSTQLSREFSAKVITFTNTDGNIVVHLEGNIYARKS